LARNRQKVRRSSAAERVPRQVARAVKEVASMDCRSDSRANGRRLKCLTLLAEHFSHQCAGLTVDYGISGEYVMRLLKRVAIFCGQPAAVRTARGSGQPAGPLSPEGNQAARPTPSLSCHLRVFLIA
jgi:putative transposase